MEDNCYGSSTSSTESESPISHFSVLSERKGKKKKSKKDGNRRDRRRSSAEAAAEEKWTRRGKGGAVALEGYVEAMEGDVEVEIAAAGENSIAGGGGVGRTKSLTDDDLEELKGCLDLGFGFTYEEIPELCGTLPALELCYSLSQRFQDEQQQQQQQASSPIANWKISSPGDDPDEVKARLRYWAQAVACTVRLCN